MSIMDLVWFLVFCVIGVSLFRGFKALQAYRVRKAFNKRNALLHALQSQPVDIMFATLKTLKILVNHQNPRNFRLADAIRGRNGLKPYGLPQLAACVGSWINNFDTTDAKCAAMKHIARQLVLSRLNGKQINFFKNQMVHRHSSLATGFEVILNDELQLWQERASQDRKKKQFSRVRRAGYKAAGVTPGRKRV